MSGNRPHAESRLERAGGRTALLAWGGILVGPTAWGIALGASYVLVPIACDTGWMWTLHGVRALMVAVAAAAAAGAYLAWGGANADDPAPEASFPFLAFAGVVASGVSVALIVVEWIANFVVDPCL